VSCSGDTGPQGLTGPAGLDGADGTDGNDGADGNADVFASDWFSPPTYALTTGFGGINLLEHDQAASEISQEILDTGVVLVYGNLRGYNTSIWPFQHVALMPITLTYGQAPTNIDSWTAILSAGNIKIRFINNNNSYTSLSTLHEFRYVVIPSTTSPGRTAVPLSLESVVAELAGAGVDINNCQDVLDYYRR